MATRKPQTILFSKPAVTDLIQQIQMKWQIQFGVQA